MTRLGMHTPGGLNFAAFRGIIHDDHGLASAGSNRPRSSCRNTKPSRPLGSQVGLVVGLPSGRRLPDADARVCFRLQPDDDSHCTEHVPVREHTTACLPIKPSVVQTAIDFPP